MPPKVDWADIQEKVFTRWCNDYLSERGMFVKSLKEDLKSGLMLCNLLEILSGKSVGRINKHPTIGIQKMENINLALDFIKKEGIKLVNIGAEDINSGNMRIILGLIWTLILRFEIKAGGDGNDSAANELLEWIRSKIPEYDIKGFTKDWNDGRAICALTNAMSPGLIPDHRSKDPNNAFNNANQGIEAAWQNLGVDKLIMPEEMVHPKVDKMGMMCYLAQFRNIKEVKKISDASRCQAFGPGLVEGIAGQEAPFTVLVPNDCEGKLAIKVEGPEDAAKVNVKKKDDGNYDVSYMPTVPGMYRVHVTMGGEHIPGSIFEVFVLENESLGGEGKIRVFFSTTSSSEKGRKDRRDLETLFELKKVHLRPDFEPWHPVDILERDDREAIFRKAGTRTLPIVFIDDKYVGDYDRVKELNEQGKLDGLLAMKGVKLVSEAEHMARLKAEGADAKTAEVVAEAKAAPKAAGAAGGGGGGGKFCGKCGVKNTAKFCTGCGSKM